MQSDARDILKSFSTGKIIWPVLIGLGVATWLLLREFDIDAYSRIQWTTSSTLWLCMAGVMVFVRDFAYMVRIRVLTDGELTWYRSFIVIMLWEFASSLAPGLLGGGFFFAILILNKEGINMGRSITAILYSSFLDGIFLAIMAPLVYFTVGKDVLFSGFNLDSVFGSGIFYSFWLIYYIILIYKLVVGYALFVNPQFVKRVLISLFSIALLKRWREHVEETGNQLIIASKGLQGKNFRYWFWSLGATFASWTARYSIVNFLIHAFHGNKPLYDLAVYGKQVIMGILILVSPTPGGSGVAEYIFKDFLGEYIPHGLAATLGLLWRLMSYYPYLFVGAIILPKWIRSHFKKMHL
ncbi:MAG: lysylphosphatidylglycerol synthase transmembrane domain-containing protein [Bacteroidota bacterium]